MTNGRGHLPNLASLFAGSDPEEDSNYDDDMTIASNRTGGASYFDKLSLASKDNLDILCDQDTARDGDDLNDVSETSRARAVRCAGDLPRTNHDDCDQRVLQLESNPEIGAVSRIPLQALALLQAQRLFIDL